MQGQDTATMMNLLKKVLADLEIGIFNKSELSRVHVFVYNTMQNGFAPVFGKWIVAERKLLADARNQVAAATNREESQTAVSNLRELESLLPKAE